MGVSTLSLCRTWVQKLGVYLTHIKPLVEHLFQRSNLLGFKGIIGMIAIEASNSLPTIVFLSSPFYPMQKELVSGNKLTCGFTNTPVNKMTG
jgi:hypothetical protein